MCVFTTACMHACMLTRTCTAPSHTCSLRDSSPVASFQQLTRSGAGDECVAPAGGCAPTAHHPPATTWSTARGPQEQHRLPDQRFDSHPRGLEGHPHTFDVSSPACSGVSRGAGVRLRVDLTTSCRVLPRFNLLVEHFIPQGNFTSMLPQGPVTTWVDRQHCGHTYQQYCSYI